MSPRTPPSTIHPSEPPCINQNSTGKIAYASDSPSLVLDVFHTVSPTTRGSTDERHSSSAAFSQALKNIAACSARGTLLILSDALGAPASVAASPHVTLRPLSLYQRELPALGFELRSLTPLYFYLNNVQLQDQGESMAEDFAKDEARQLISSTNLSVGCWIRM